MPSPLVDRFRHSMVMDRERWHDGTGYDLALLGEATTSELAEIESLLTSHGVQDWRDVQALATLDTPRCREAVRAAFMAGGLAVRAMIVSQAPALFPDEERTEAMVAALEDENSEAVLDAVLREAETHHPPAVVLALLRGVRTRSPRIAGDFAMMLLVIHGQAESPWDMKMRPFLLRFQEEERLPLFRELCRRIGVDAGSVA